MTSRILQGDVLRFCAKYDGEPFHALLCDPPYHLTSISKRFQDCDPAYRSKTTAKQYHRLQKGFMGKEWDGGDIAFQPETWAALAEHLYPGAFIMAFAGTRGYHRMAVAMEDAGLLIHPAIGWLFGSGFPKSTRIDRQIDEREGVSILRGKGFNVAGKDAAPNLGIGDGSKPHTAVTESAKVWAGHRYGMQALKPAFEFIAVAQKPYSGKPVDSITKTGAGALNVDAGRIESGRGRWPANLCLDEVGAAALDAQSGVLTSGQPCGARNAQTGFASGITPGMPLSGFGDTGGASRFYHVSDWTPELAESDPFLYAAKAGTAERNAGLEGMPEQFHAGHLSAGDGRNPESPTSCVGGQQRRIERGLTPTEPSRNPHPTIKPLKLCRWLASLLLPPKEYAPRRILIPFAGSGSECIGAHLAGWEEIVGIEREAEYAEIARARLKFWQGNAGLFEALTAEEPETQEQEVMAL